MAFYNYEYPYTDPNRYNNDWILNEIKKLIEYSESGTLDEYSAKLFNLIQIVGEERQYTPSGTHNYKRNIDGINIDTWNPDAKFLTNAELASKTSLLTFMCDDIPGSDSMYFYLNSTFNSEIPTQTEYVLTEQLSTADFPRFNRNGIFFVSPIFITTDINTGLRNYDFGNLYVNYSGGYFTLSVKPFVPHISTCYISNIYMSKYVSY